MRAANFFQRVQQAMAGRPKLKTCEKCGREYFIYHPDNECQSSKDHNKKEKPKNGKKAVD